jgi:hypothetical protein
MEINQTNFSHSLRENPMDEASKDTLRLDFDSKLKLEFHGSKVTSDGGLLAYREIDNAFGLTSIVSSELRDVRTGKNTQHGLATLLRQSIYSRVAGYYDTNDAERLALDPAMQHVAGGRALNWMRLFYHDFVDNQVRLQQFALAYNLGNFLSRLVLPKPVKKWSLREKLIKIGAMVVRYFRYVVFQMTEVAVSRALLAETLDRIGRLRSSPELAGTA